MLATSPTPIRLHEPNSRYLRAATSSRQMQWTKTKYLRMMITGNHIRREKKAKREKKRKRTLMDLANIKKGTIHLERTQDQLRSRMSTVTESLETNWCRPRSTARGRPASAPRGAGWTGSRSRQAMRRESCECV